MSQENKLDLKVWEKFLTYPDMFSKPFIDATEVSALELDMYSDASGNHNLGMGAHCGPEWAVLKWDCEFMKRNEPSIEYLELFTVTVAVLNWIKLFPNRRVVLFCDNESVVHMINSSSSCRNCMYLEDCLSLGLILEGFGH